MQRLEVEVLLNVREGTEEEMHKRYESSVFFILVLVNFCRKQMIDYEFVSVNFKKKLFSSYVRLH